MSDNSEKILEKIRWDIRDEVVNAEWKRDGEDPQWKTGNLLSEEDLDTPVFSDVDEEFVSLRFYVDDSWSIDVERQISSKATVRSLLTFIRDFYAEKMEPELYERIRANLDDDVPEYDEYFKNIDAFDDMIGLPFEGLEPEGGLLYEVTIGPL
jgi:hypothetical protein